MSEFETHPLAVIEALELGRPALVADTSGLRELAQMGAARAVPVDQTPEELAAEMLAALSNPQTIVPSQSAPTWQECSDRLLALYREVLSAQPAATHAAAATPLQGE
jgi:glycosyltransferase involved in cell wall biosynthesis